MKRTEGRGWVNLTPQANYEKSFSVNYTEIAGLYSKHLNPGFIQLLETLGYARLMVKAEGCWTWDDRGRKFLDLVAGFGSMNLGHHHPALHEAVHEALSHLPYNYMHTGPSGAAAELAQALCKRVRAPLDRVLLSCSGAEAVEGAIKIAALATRRYQVIYVEDAFHGTSLGTLGLMGKDRMRKPFESLLGDHIRIPFNSIPSLENALKHNKCAAFIVEPVLAEGGVCFPKAGYLDEARELCHRHGALFIVDEIQTGLGRVGSFLATDGMMKNSPDVIVLGKALSGGLLPISATLTSSSVFERAFRKKEDFDLHSSTFAGNALACAVARRTVELIESENLSQRSAELGQEFLSKLKEALAGHPLVREVRGQGLLIGIEIGPTQAGLMNRVAPGLVTSASQLAIGQWFALKLLEKGVLLQTASHRWDILKIEPPLTIQTSEIEFAVQAIREVFDAYQSVPKIGWELTRRFTQQSFNSQMHL
jgi:putrescine aminotransferase